MKINSPKKIIILVLLPLLTLVSMFYIVLSGVIKRQEERRIVDIRSRQEQAIISELRGRVESVFSLIEYYEAAGKSEEECKQIINSLHFGDMNYIWVHQIDRNEPDSAFLLVHPSKKYINTDISALVDLDSIEEIYYECKLYPKSDPVVSHIKPTHISREFNKVCFDKGSGVVRYYWPKIIDGKETKAGYLKLSYVKLCPNWNWIVGAGAYADHIDHILEAEKQSMKREYNGFWKIIIWTFVVLILIIGSIAAHISRKVAMGIIQYQRELEEANIAKSDFLANMSHEIRTPMNAIIGFSEMLLNEEMEKEQLDSVKTIHNSGKNLLTIINDILDFSKIESGKLDIEVIKYSLESILASASSILRPRAIEKGLDFQIIHKSQLPAYICTDPTRLYQCLANLLGNAIKFTESGHVHLFVSLEGGEDNAIVCFEVEDTGIGIAEDKLESIFESFSQADSSTSRKYGGTGLGLAITKQLVKLLGGELVVKSELGKGSNFTIRIPAGLNVNSQPLLGENIVKDTGELSKKDQVSFTGNILIAEDNPANQKLIMMLLKKVGLNPTVVDDGQKAVEAVIAGAFDIIFMDMQMPIMNGYEATREIRKKGITTPVIAFTANAMKDDEQKCIDSGCNGYLSKPVDKKKLYDFLNKYLQKDELLNV